jgi:hypothetical protein
MTKKKKKNSGSDYSSTARWGYSIVITLAIFALGWYSIATSSNVVWSVYLYKTWSPTEIVMVVTAYEIFFLLGIAVCFDMPEMLKKSANHRNTPQTPNASAARGNLNVVVPHKLTRDEAINRIKRLLSEVKAGHADKITSINEEWKDNLGTFTLEAMGYSVTGTITVENASVEFDANLPFPASMAKGTIAKTVKDKATALLV